jgi:pimeloyl-ACP methyl ester carboxylesterase
MSALVVEGGVAHYEYFGRARQRDDPPLIFIHGWLGSWRYWVPAMNELSESRRVYAIDLWGFGDSDKSRDRYSVENYVNLLATFIDTLGVRPPLPLVGHALGAAVAVSFALEHPGFVDRIMAVSLPLASETINTRFLSRDNFLDKILGRSPMGGYEDWVRQEARRAAPEAIEKSIQSVINIDLHRQLRALEIPLLILYGENDTVIPPADPGDLADLNKSVRMVVIPEARHFPMLDHSSQFNRLLLDFLESDANLDDLTLKEEWQRRIR